MDPIFIPNHVFSRLSYSDLSNLFQELQTGIWNIAAANCCFLLEMRAQERKHVKSDSRWIPTTDILFVYLKILFIPKRLGRIKIFLQHLHFLTLHSVHVKKQGQTGHKLQIATFWDIYIYISHYLPVYIYIYIYIYIYTYTGSSR